MTRHGDGTRVVRAGLPEAEQGTPFLPGPVFAGPFHLAGEVDTSPRSYTRYGNPTWERYEAALAELEGGEVVLFASGMAAAAALLLTSLRPGSALAMDRDCYLGVRRLVRHAPGAARRGGAPGPPRRADRRASGRRHALARVTVEPQARRLRHRGAGRGGARRRRAQRRGQHDRGPARPEGARPRVSTSRSRAPPSTFPATPT